MILEKEKRLQRGCAQVLLRLASQQDEKAGFQETRRNSAAGPQTLHKGFKWKHEQGRNLEAQSKHSANKCPSYGHHRRAGAQESQGSQGKETSLASPLSLQGPWGPGREVGLQGGIGAWEEIHRVPWGRCLEEGSQMSQTESRARGGHCGRVCTAFEDGKFTAGGEQAAEIKRECGGLWLCIGSIALNISFSSGGPNTCLRVCRTTDLQP